MTDDGGPQTPGITRQNLAAKKDPDVRALTRSGDLQGIRYLQGLTGEAIGLGVFPPVTFIEVSGEKMTGVVFQQGIDPDCSLASKMLVENAIGEWHEASVGTFATLDGWLPTNPGLSIIQTNGGVAHLAGVIALPSFRKDIGSPPKKPPNKVSFSSLENSVRSALEPTSALSLSKDTRQSMPFLSRRLINRRFSA